MITPQERTRLQSAYRAPVSASAALARCAAGLLVIAGIASVGVVTSAGDERDAARVSVPRVASSH